MFGAEPFICRHAAGFRSVRNVELNVCNDPINEQNLVRFSIGLFDGEETLQSLILYIFGCTIIGSLFRCTECYCAFVFWASLLALQEQCIRIIPYINIFSFRFGGIDRCMDRWMSKWTDGQIDRWISSKFSTWRFQLPKEQPGAMKSSCTV